MRKISQQFDECDRKHCGHKVVVILGMGGQGKSPLALDYGRKSLNVRLNQPRQKRAPALTGGY